MNRQYDSDIDLEDMRSQNDDGREISLGTTTVLGIFFALALVCAVFFGFGYSTGRKSAQPQAAEAAATQPAADTNPNTAKPAPGSLQESPEKPAADAAATDTTSAPTTTTADTPPDATTDQPTQAAQPPVKTVALAHPTVPQPVTTPVPAAGAATIIVQVAAVSHKEDAAMLLSALKKRGYTGTIRQEPQDKLLHVQLGPFATKKDADTMKQRLIADGYNPIVK